MSPKEREHRRMLEDNFAKWVKYGEVELPGYWTCHPLTMGDICDPFTLTEFVWGYYNEKHGVPPSLRAFKKIVILAQGRTPQQPSTIRGRVLENPPTIAEVRIWDPVRAAQLEAEAAAKAAAQARDAKEKARIEAEQKNIQRSKDQLASIEHRVALATTAAQLDEILKNEVNTLFTQLYLLEDQNAARLAIAQRAAELTQEKESKALALSQQRGWSTGAKVAVGAGVLAAGVVVVLVSRRLSRKPRRKPARRRLRAA